MEMYFIFIGLGAILMLVGFVILKVCSKHRKACSSETIGVIVDIKEDSFMEDGRWYTNRTPVIEYYANGRVFRQEHDINGLTKDTVGEQVKVRYSPSNPDDIYIPGKFFHIFII